MKRKFPPRRLALKSFALLLASLAFICSVAGPVPSAFATTEVDRLYALDSVGYLRSWDNVDGLFADYVATAYREYFGKQSRFVLNDLSKADSVLTRSKLPYHRVIEDKEILAQLARTTRTQSLIRTKVTKEGPRYRFVLEWMHTPKMDVMASDTFYLNEPQDGQAFGLGNIQNELHQGLDRMFAKVPFVGQVTGRDESSVTLNLGESANLKPGDTVQIATLDQVKKHPLLNEIVEWRLTPTGKVVVESVDDKITFTRIVEEEEGRRISRYQKITQILPKPVAPEPKIVDDAQQRLEDLEKPPALGYLSVGAGVGSFSRDFAGTSVSNMSFGFTGKGQLWLNRNWFAEAQVGFSTFSLGSLNQFKIATGYTYLVTPEFFGPKAWVKGGYQSTSYSLPNSISFGSLLLGIGAELPVRDAWGITANVDFGLIPSASEAAVTSTNLSVNRSGGSVADVSFFVGGFYRMNSRATVRAGLEVLSHSATVPSQSNLAGGTISQKNITFGPSLLYYF